MHSTLHTYTGLHTAQHTPTQDSPPMYRAACHRPWFIGTLLWLGIICITSTTRKCGGEEMQSEYGRSMRNFRHCFFFLFCMIFGRNGRWGGNVIKFKVLSGSDHCKGHGWHAGSIKASLVAMAKPRPRVAALHLNSKTENSGTPWEWPTNRKQIQHMGSSVPTNVPKRTGPKMCNARACIERLCNRSLEGGGSAHTCPTLAMKQLEQPSAACRVQKKAAVHPSKQGTLGYFISFFKS